MQKNSLEQWVNNLPTEETPKNPQESSIPKINIKTKSLSRDYSFQSDDGTSHCSSVESVLELRKPDPEEILLELGFGPRKNSEKINRIPSRFLQPSKLLPHIDINQFLEEYGSKGSESNSISSSPSRTRPRSN